MVSASRGMMMRLPCRSMLVALLWSNPVVQLMAEQDILIIDDRAGDAALSARNDWRFVADGVMGGVSSGRMDADEVGGRSCLRLQGEVRLDNNGGFIQGALEVSDKVRELAAGYTGILLDVYGNGEQYNVHLRTGDLWLPWQSYRTTFTATPDWQTLYLPFTGFEAYRTGKALDTARLERIGIVAIGRAFTADVCIARIGLYR